MKTVSFSYTYLNGKTYSDTVTVEEARKMLASLEDSEANTKKHAPTDSGLTRINGNITAKAIREALEKIDSLSIVKIELFSGYLKLVYSDGSKLISSSKFINEGSKKYLSGVTGQNVKVGDGLFIKPLDGSGDAIPVIVTKVFDIVGQALEIIPVGSDKPEIFKLGANGFFTPGWIRPLDGALTHTFDASRVLAN